MSELGLPAANQEDDPTALGRLDPVVHADRQRAPPTTAGSASRAVLNDPTFANVGSVSLIIKAFTLEEGLFHPHQPSHVLRSVMRQELKYIVARLAPRLRANISYRRLFPALTAIMLAGLVQPHTCHCSCIQLPGHCTRAAWSAGNLYNGHGNHFSPSKNGSGARGGVILRTYTDRETGEDGRWREFLAQGWQAAGKYRSALKDWGIAALARAEPERSTKETKEQGRNA